MLDPGLPAPAFAGTELFTEAPFSLANHRGKVVVVAFSGITWCGPCQTEAPVLQNLWQYYDSALYKLQYRPLVQFVMIVVPVTGEEITPEIMESHGITSIPTLVSSSAFPALYDVSSYPTLYVIDEELKICGSHVGAGSGGFPSLQAKINDMVTTCGDRRSKELQRLTADLDEEWIDPLDYLREIRTRPPLGPEAQEVMALLKINELAGQLPDPETRRSLQATSLQAAESNIGNLLSTIQSETGPRTTLIRPYPAAIASSPSDDAGLDEE